MKKDAFWVALSAFTSRGLLDHDHKLDLLNPATDSVKRKSVF